MRKIVLGSLYALALQLLLIPAGKQIRRLPKSPRKI